MEASTNQLLDGPGRPLDTAAPVTEPHPARAWRAWVFARRDALLLAAILVAGTVLRLWESGSRSLWFDEAASWRLTRLPWGRMIGAVGRDNHVPLHHIMLKLWTAALGDSVWSMRVFTAAMSAVAVWATYGFCACAFGETDGATTSSTSSGRAPGRWIGLLAAAFVAISLPQIRAGWEVRMYSLGTALTALGGWTLFRALLGSRGASGRGNGRWAVHGLVTLAMAYTHPFLLFSVAAQALFVCGYFLCAGPQDGRGLREWRTAVALRAGVTYAAVAAGFAVWVPVLLQQARQVQGGFWTGPFTMSDVANACYAMFLDGNPPPATALAAAVVCGGVVFLLAAVGRAGHWYALVSAVVPFAMGAAVSSVGRNVFVARYLVFANLFLLVGLAALVAEVRGGRCRAVLAAALLLGGAAADATYWFALDMYGKPGMRAAMAYVEAHRKPGELVIVTSPVVYFPAVYHLKPKYRPACRLLSDGRPIPHFVGGAFVEESDLIGDSEIARLGPGRVWVIDTAPRASGFDAPTAWRLTGDQEFREVFKFEAFFVNTFEVPPR